MKVVWEQDEDRATVCYKQRENSKKTQKKQFENSAKEKEYREKTVENSAGIC